MALINIPDPGAKYTDEEIKALEEKINSIYSEAQSDIQKKLDDHTAKFQKKDTIYQKKLQDKEITQAEYDAWKKGQVFTGKQWAAKKQEITAVLNNSNKVAAAMINSSAIDVFSENANFLSYSLEHTAGANFGFGLYNTDAVTKLIKDDPQVLPKWKIDQKKDYIWNQQNLNRSLTQGIIQGESLDKISKRVSTNLAGSNKNLMKTFAKTGMTQAQNSGRLSQLERAKALGLNVKKEWIATLDARTRTAHQELDGQSVDLDKPFKAEGYSIRYPGDPEAHPSLVYNCRCALAGDLVDYPATYNRYDNIAGKPIKGMNYKQWKDAKAKGEDLSPIPLTYKQFKSKEQQMLTDLFKDKTITGLYNQIKKTDVTTGNKLWKVMSENGKPSENWPKYVNGTMPAEQMKKVDQLLKKYGEDTGLIKEPVNLSAMFKGTKVTPIYHDIGEYDKTLANQYWKELSKMGKPSDVWAKYLADELSDEETLKINNYLEKYLKKMDSVKATVQNGKSIVLAETAGDASDIVKLENAQKKLNDLEKELAKLDSDLIKINKTYSGIWKNDVTVADYPAKAASIQAKKDYYYEQLKDLDYKLNNGDIGEHLYGIKVKQFTKYIDDLEEFQTLGKKYADDIAEKIKSKDKLVKDIAKAKTAVKDLMPSASSYPQSRLDAGLWPKSRSQADQLYLDRSKAQYKAATAAERDGVYEYTKSYHKYNEPLRGIEYGSEAYKGVGKTNLDAGSTHNGKRLNAMTDYIEKCVSEDDQWLQRGCRFSGMDKFLDVDMSILKNGSLEQLENELLGKTVTEYGFMSCGTAKGTGFSGDILFNIFAPKGTKMTYAEAYSYYKGGSEVETILQQGSQFIVTKIEKKGGQIYMDLELINQLPPQRWTA